jgi:hypothetical protein
MIGEGDCGKIGGMKIGRGNRSTRRKPAPAPLCPPQIPLDQTQDRTRAAAVGSHRLTAWAMARPKEAYEIISMSVCPPYFFCFLCGPCHADYFFPELLVSCDNTRVLHLKFSCRWRFSLCIITPYSLVGYIKFSEKHFVLLIPSSCSVISFQYSLLHLPQKLYEKEVQFILHRAPANSATSPAQQYCWKI